MVPAPVLIMKTVAEQMRVISSGAVEILPEGEMEKKLARSLKTGKPLRVKQGFDPTAPDIHLGHTVGLRKLRQFQELGHTIVLIVGDCTGMVGDPSGRSATRPRLSEAEVEANARTYLDQFFKVLDRSQTEVRKNGEWFARMSFSEIMHLASRITVSRMLERDDFDKRFKAEAPISIHEMFYPLMQAYDSVAVEADVEIGGTDQKFNLLTGRQIQEAYGKEPQVILTMPLIVGTDGAQKMSKSLGNYICIDEPPEQIFGKTMSIPDELIVQYFVLVTDVPLEEIATIRAELTAGTVNPMIHKKALAETIVRMYHGTEAAHAARANFEQVFSQKQRPDQIDELRLARPGQRVSALQLAMDTGFPKTKGEARRMISQGGFYVDDVRRDDPFSELPTDKPLFVKYGKKKFVNVVYV
jgi:tyrosyl-tRNA synthetase